ncbi:hypothetical protein [Catenovulum adriaticum]|uniref:Uncharacterized protein n=1 Tax=Catenovulum adriaticum TaxID=2984846 RepID=A0ABY7AK84_9ALTE|nr:hypothetical protein [Catenovulum sp. TS8]WAJ69735.1 hypothetical protein OLW01_11300 [Catenovulum sp. TS8]
MTDNQLDITEFNLVCNQTLAFIERVDKNNLNGAKYFAQFVEYAKNEIQKNHKKLDDIKFTYLECWGIYCSALKPNKNLSPDDEYEKKIRNCEKLLSLFLTDPKFKDEYLVWLKRQGCRHYLKFESSNTEGGNGNASLRYLILKPINEIESFNIGDPITEIEYQLIQLPKLWWLPRILSSINLVGWNKWVYVSVPALLFIEAYATLTLYMHFHLYALGSIALLVFICNLVVFFPFRTYFSLTNSRVAIAPSWMVPFKIREAQLVSIAEGEHRKIEMRVYQSECPICGAEVDVVKGKGEFKKRLIGQCYEAGNEHIFSFDHVTKKGVPLRSNGYYRVHNFSKSEETN